MSYLKDRRFDPNEKSLSETLDRNAALREIAGRIKKLSYRDLKKFGDTMRYALAQNEPGQVEEALLLSADTMEKM